MKHARPDYDRIQDPSGLIPADEPVILLRAQDKHFRHVLRFYRDIVAADNGDPKIVAAINEHLVKADAWSVRKSPDMPGSEPDRAVAAQHADEPSTAREPVAWRVTWLDDKTAIYQEEPVGFECVKIEPLYTALSVPQGDQAREVAIRAVQLSYARTDLEPTSEATLKLYRADAEHAADAVLRALSSEVKKP